MAQTDHKLELLKRVPLFKDLSAHDLDQVELNSEEVDVPAGQVLTREGAPGSDFFLISDGSVRIDHGGQTVRTMGAGDFLGEIALIDDSPRTATATTETPTKLIVLSRREFRSLMDGHPSIEAAVLRCLIERVKTHEPSFSH